MNSSDVNAMQVLTGGALSGRTLSGRTEPHPWFTAARSLWLALGLCCAGLGCDEKPAAPTTTGAATTAGAAVVPAGQEAGPVQDRAQDDLHHCDALIDSIWDIFNLKKLGISSDLKFGVSLLNQWSTNCGKIEGAADANLPDAVQPLLDGQQEKEIAQKQFDRRDGEHLRDSVLFKAVVSHAVGKGETELSRVLNVFQYTMRSVNLIERHPFDLPLSPYRFYLLGKGTAADRAWIFVELLRQLKIDGVVLVPAGADKSAETLEMGPLLVAVLLDDQVYLFDPRIGLPLLPPGSAAKDPLHVGAATLQQALADSAVLEQFKPDDEHPYAWTADSLRAAQVGVVGNSTLWSVKMRRLQTELIGDRALIVYDGLGDIDGHPGQWSRVTQAKGHEWQPESLFLWKYPESQLASRAELSAEQRDQAQILVDHWKVPLPMQINPQNGELIFGKPEYEHFKSRLEQVSGAFDQAIVGFSSIRLHNGWLPPMPNNPKERALFAQAAEEANFQTGVCQFESGQYKTAIKTFQKFLTSTPAGPWASPSRYHLALAYAAMGEYQEAIAALEKLSTKSPYYPGCQILIHLWRAHVEAAAR